MSEEPLDNLNTQHPPDLHGQADEVLDNDPLGIIPSEKDLANLRPSQPNIPDGPGDLKQTDIEAAEYRLFYMAGRRTVEREIFGKEKKELLSTIHESEEAHKDEVAAHTQTRRELKTANERAGHDKLTGLYNRDAFLEKLDTEIGHIRRAGDANRVHHIAMFDLDDFKSANDTEGHRFGDEVLLSFAATLKDELAEQGHLVARWGGEEFVVLLEDTTTANAVEMLEHVRRLMRNTRFKLREAGPKEEYYPPITVSVGVTEVRQRGEPDVAIDQADRALYASKFEGKNRVTLYEEGMRYTGEHERDRRRANDQR